MGLKQEHKASRLFQRGLSSFAEDMQPASRATW